MAKKIKIDEAKCNGCGVCVPKCGGGAIKIVNGKAKVLSDKCDALGACLPDCPQGAITFEDVLYDHGLQQSGCPAARILDPINKPKCAGK
jgi:ferredoxin